YHTGMTTCEHLLEPPASDPRTELNGVFAETPGLEDVQMRINRDKEWAITGTVASTELRDKALGLLRAVLQVEEGKPALGRTWNFLEIKDAPIAEKTGAV
ncbi:MAG: hypothetical protein PHS73_02735, partial [Candidatus Peribacteraceae bacterium]|nr:hypothetical protein [Candidatus Peribacteraceae bacterium]